MTTPAERRADYRRRRYLRHGPLSTDATGTRRRIRALAAIGWSTREQSRRLGLDPSTLHKVTCRSWVWVVTAEKVAALYDELSMTPGPNVRARNDARRRGWPPPLAWDDDTIDDPAARSARIGAPIPSRMNRDADREEQVMRLTRCGLSAAEIALRLRTNTRYVQRVRARNRTEGEVA